MTTQRLLDEQNRQSAERAARQKRESAAMFKTLEEQSELSLRGISTSLISQDFIDDTSPAPPRPPDRGLLDSIESPVSRTASAVGGGVARFLDPGVDPNPPDRTLERSLAHDPNALIFPQPRPSDRTLRLFTTHGGSVERLDSFSTQRMDKDAVALSKLRPFDRIQVLMSAGWAPNEARALSKEIDYTFGTTGNPKGSLAKGPLDLFNVVTEELGALAIGGSQLILEGDLPSAEEAILKGQRDVHPLLLGLAGDALMFPAFPVGALKTSLRTTARVGAEAADLGISAVVASGPPVKRGFDLLINNQVGGGRLPTGAKSMQQLRAAAKGPKKLTPQERAVESAKLRPIDEEGVLWRTGDIEHYDNFLQNASNKPVTRWLNRWINPNRSIEAGENLPRIAAREQLFREIEKNRFRARFVNIKREMQHAFRFDSNGIARSVRSSATGVSRKVLGTIDDIIENPARYSMTPRQQKILDAVDEMQRQMLRDMQALGVDITELQGAYWHRIVKRGPKGATTGTPPRFGKTGKRAVASQRAFRTVEEATEGGWVYETDPFVRLDARIKAGVDAMGRAHSRRAVADLFGETTAERFALLSKETGEQLAAAKASRQSLLTAIGRAKRAADPDEQSLRYLDLKQVEQQIVDLERDMLGFRRRATPGFGETLIEGRIVPIEYIKQAEEYLGKISRTTPMWLEILQLSRALLTVLDYSVAFMQGGTLFFRNTPAWLQAVGHSLVSIVDEADGYVRKHWETLDEGIKVAAISPPAELVFPSTGLASIPLRTPILGAGVRAANRAFQNFIMVGQHQLYLAARKGVIKGVDGGDATQDLISLGSAIRKQLGVESYAVLGVKPTQAAIESILAFAPRFYRANIGLIAQAFTRGKGGAEARRAMGQLVGGGIALTYGINVANGDRMNLTNPFDDDFLSFRIPGTSGTRFNLFGPYYTLLRQFARMGHNIENGDYLRATNDLKAWGQSKEGLGVRFVETVGKFAFAKEIQDFQGRIIPKTPLGFVQHVGQEFTTPIAAGETAQGLQEGRPEAALDFIGLAGRSSAFSQANAWWRSQTDINPDGQSLRDNSRLEDMLFRQRVEERGLPLIKNMTAAQRGRFGRSSRREEERRQERNNVLMGFYNDNEAQIQQGNPEVVRNLRRRVKKILEEEIIAKNEARANFNTYFDGDREPKDETDQALFEYWDIFFKQPGEGGARLFAPGVDPERNIYGGKLDPDLADELLHDWQAKWGTEMAETVREVSGPKGLPPQLQEIVDLDDRLSGLDYYNGYRHSDYWNNDLDEDLQRLYLAYLDRKRAGTGPQWFDEAAINEGVNRSTLESFIGSVENAERDWQREIRTANPDLDLQMATLLGSPPATFETSADIASRRIGPDTLRILVNRGGSGRIPTNVVNLMLDLGIRDLSELAETDPEELGKAKGIGEKVARWYVLQAQVILEEQERQRRGRAA